MKRIDDKLKEIEKKDKRNRIIYISFVLVIIAFMATVFFSSRKIEAQEQVINDQGEIIELTGQELYNKTVELEKTIERLEQSQTPTGFWKETQEYGTAKAYLDYITHDRETPKVTFRDEAVAQIVQDSIDGQIGWLYVGRKNADELSEGFTNVAWRNATENMNENWMPEENDIIMYKKGNGARYTYSSLTRAKNKSGTKKTWNMTAKAIVLKKEMDGPTAVYLKITF